jgi:hypothetical protein
VDAKAGAEEAIRKQGVEGKPSRVTMMSNKVLNKAKLCRVEGLNKAKPVVE